jgi:tetratricopeptide (TPR) repeat protein
MTSRWLALAALVSLPTGCSGTVTKPVGPMQPADDGRNADALYRQGIESEKREDFSRAEQYFSAALGRGYPESRAVPRLVRVCLASARLRTALHYAEPYLARHPDDPALLNLMAAIRLSLGDGAGARAALDHALELAPNYAPARYLLAVVLRDAFDEPEASERELNRYLLASPEGEHAAEARSLLREVTHPRRHATFKAPASKAPELATDRPQAPIPPYRGGIGSRSSSPTDSPVASGAARPVAR